MSDYRVYTLDRQGRILSAEWIAADSDAKAIDLVTNRDGTAACEIWLRERLVASLPPNRFE